jgi:GPH family glycoside/pentoside/hexuronide:cation symporter
MCTALFSDTVIYGEWKTGKNIRALTMGLLNLPVKIGVLLRSAVVTLGFMAIGFAANTAPAPKVVNGIASLMTFSPAVVCALGAVIFFFGYRMEEAQVVKMQEEIAARSAVQSPKA